METHLKDYDGESAWLLEFENPDRGPHKSIHRSRIGSLRKMSEVTEKWGDVSGGRYDLTEMPLED